MNDLYTVDEVAEMLRVTTKTIYLHLKEGKLKGSKVGRYWRISKSQIDDFLKGE